ncbi:tyrosine-type recombinase/integrase [Pseudomonas eucalypticola]|uniref:Tyrosine-type recombinase/integrase n=1 Tax=Pseudomonas eucalypticola TaxID=2599595 RepID=A0A7D5D9F4_9PSED|nr:tyrosine-type recombinase/integrase [Pseudomonas eucalypticola]QKZ06037.1 tyrosine-type recombinase/integrase [Pseudomonas eucalypticola]
MSDYLEEQERLIAEFESDAEEAAMEAFEALLEETAGRIDTAKHGLLSKLALFPDGDFPVSLYSEYRDAVWTMTDETKGRPVRIRFELEMPGLSELKRALTYHLLPAFTPFARIKSFTSSKSKAHDFRFIEMYLLAPNRLSAIPEHLQLITLPMLNQALDDAKDSGKPSHYTGLFFTLRFWHSLSAHKLIPEELRLSPELSGIDTRERHKDVQDTFSGSLQTWVPFSEGELEKLVNYALFWINDAAPRLLEARALLMENGLDQMVRGKIRRTSRQTDFENALAIEINGTEVLNYSMTEGEHGGAHVYSYFWIKNFSQAIDKVRNAVFVFVALVTGMRKTELGLLTFDDVVEDQAGLYWIDITRFKTTTDANYHGETERLPLPRFVGESVKALKTLRSFWTFYRNGFIFQTTYNTTPVTNEKPLLPPAIIVELEEETGIDRIHAHRFRKTIAEILIHRSERNIDLIRMLFGHHSYAMTLRYISRNPYLVRGVAQALEESYSKEFHEIVSAVRDGGFSGDAADRLAQQISRRPEDFKGKRLKVSILVYVSHLLSAGSPIYVGRTAVGTYCVSGDEFDETNLPPCLVGRQRPEGRIRPDPGYCQNECRNAVVIGKAEQALEENVRFYETLLENGSSSMTVRSRQRIQAKIDAHKRHLNNLHNTEVAKSLQIPLLEVS